MLKGEDLPARPPEPMQGSLTAARTAVAVKRAKALKCILMVPSGWVCGVWRINPHHQPRPVRPKPFIHAELAGRRIPMTICTHDSVTKF